VTGPLLLLVPLAVALSTLGYFLFRTLRQPLSVMLPPMAGGGGAEDVRRELAGLLGGMTGGVPADVIARYESLQRRMLAMLPRQTRREGISPELFILHRTASDYLPGAVRSYLVLVQSGDPDQPLADGRTPHQILLAQLELIESTLTDVAVALSRNDADRVLVHGRFLEERFGPGGDLSRPQA
jgi:hypothetical protein